MKHSNSNESGAHHAPLDKTITCNATRIGIGLCLSLALAACGGGYKNQAPVISNIAAQSIDQDTSSAPLSFTVSDKETPAAQLQVTVTSSNSTLVQPAGLALAGTDSARTLQVTPVADQSGTATITLTVTDGSGKQVQTQFALTVRDTRVAFTQYSLTAFNTASDADPLDISGTKFIYDSDDQEDAYDAEL